MTLGTSPRIWFALILAAFTCLPLASLQAQETADATGTWVATVPGPQGDIQLTLKMENTDGSWTGTLQGARRTTDVEKLQVLGNAVSFSVPNPEMNITAKFDGTIDGNRLQGTMQAGNFPAQDLTFVRQVDEVVDEATGTKKYRVGSGPAGVWVGQVRAPDGEDSRVTLVLDKEGGDWMATIEDPFVNQVRGEDVKVTDTMISFTYRPSGAPFPSHFSGTYIAADDRVTGSFSQRGRSRFIKFERDPATVTLGVGPDGEPILPPRVRHPYKVGLTGRLSFWQSLHVVKDETYNINTLTKSTFNYDLGVKYFILDGFNVFARYFRGGQSMTDDARKLAPFEEIGLNSDSYLKLDGFEFGFNGYLGNIVTPNSSFNPYLTAAVGKASWELTESGRGSEILSLDDQEFSGSDFCVGIGLGTEYELSEKMCLEFEFMWRYFMTEDTDKWTDNDNVWSNTHAWALSAGFTYGFF